MNEVERLLTLIWKDKKHGAGLRARLRAHEALQVIQGLNADRVITLPGTELLHLKTFSRPWQGWLWCRVWLPLRALLTQATGDKS